jgi:hypothetical protein
MLRHKTLQLITDLSAHLMLLTFIGYATYAFQVHYGRWWLGLLSALLLGQMMGLVTPSRLWLEKKDLKRAID